MRLRHYQAFSLIELLITVAIIGVVAAIALPAYQNYVDTANMSKVNAAYENAVRVARQEWGKSMMRVSMGLPSTAPTTTDGWVQRLGTTTQAPGGGPIYVPYGTQDTDAKGAVMIDAPAAQFFVYIYRPAYGDLKQLRARVSAEDVVVEVIPLTSQRVRMQRL